MKRYLVVETAYLGDVLISLATAHALKLVDPDAEVTYLVRPDARDLAAASPDVDRVLVFDKRGVDAGYRGLLRKATELNAIGYDVVIALHSSKRTKELVRQLAAPTKVGFSPLRDVLSVSVEDSGWVTRYDRALLPLQSVLNVPTGLLPRVQPRRLPSVDLFISNAPAVVTIAPGSAWPTKQWPLERFRELALGLTRSGVRVMVVGGRDEEQFGRSVATESASILNLAGGASLLEAAYAIQNSQLLVANDSSPVHLAAAVGTRSCVLYGPTVPEFGFLPSTGEAIESEVWCRPCTSHGSRECPVHTHECMRSISVERVLSRVMALVGVEASAEPF